MSQELILDQYIQQLKKSRKRNYYLFGLWFLVLLLTLLSSSDFNLSILSIATLTAMIAIVAADITGQDRLLIVLKLLNQNSISQPEQETVESSAP